MHMLYAQMQKKMKGRIHTKVINLGYLWREEWNGREVVEEVHGFLSLSMCFVLHISQKWVVNNLSKNNK